MAAELIMIDLEAMFIKNMSKQTFQYKYMANMYMLNCQIYC